MFITVNNISCPVMRREVTDNSVSFYGLQETLPENINGIINLYRNDNFLLSSYNVDNYKYQHYDGTSLTLTNNEPIVTPINTVPTPMEQLRADIDYLAVMMEVEL